MAEAPPYVGAYDRSVEQRGPVFDSLPDERTFGAKVLDALRALRDPRMEAKVKEEAPDVAGSWWGMPFGILAGPKAVGAPLAKLKLAMEAEKQGVPSQQIWREHGWSKGADKKWRFEIPDDLAHLNPEVGAAGEAGGSLRDILRHEDLYKAYPQIQRIPTVVEKGEQHGMYTPGEKPMISAAATNPKDLLQILLHEGQHGVQDIEGFAGGGSPSTAAPYRTLREMQAQSVSPERRQMLLQTEEKLREQGLKTGAEQNYGRLAGEVEARNVEGRHNQPDLRRLEPALSEDVPRLLQIIKAAQNALRRKRAN